MGSLKWFRANTLLHIITQGTARFTFTSFSEILQTIGEFFLTVMLANLQELSDAGLIFYYFVVTD